jgi:hypothetical protein
MSNTTRCSTDTSSSSPPAPPTFPTPTLRAILLTAAHEPSTREKLKRVVEGSLMGVSHLGDDEHDRLIRSGLISSQIMGLALMRYVWKIEPVASMTEDEVIAAITPNLQFYIEGDLTASSTDKK